MKRQPPFPSQIAGLVPCAYSSCLCPLLPPLCQPAATGPLPQAAPLSTLWWLAVAFKIKPKPPPPPPPPATLISLLSFKVSGQWQFLLYPVGTIGHRPSNSFSLKLSNLTEHINSLRLYPLSLFSPHGVNTLYHSIVCLPR